jgi:hypothetical protein
MIVSAVKEDRVVMIDGEGLNFDYSLPDNVWAIQWDGTSGEVEYTDGTENLQLNSFDEYQFLIDGYATEKQRLVDVATQEEVDRVASLTYADHRSEAYPSLGDQADMQFHDLVNGTTTWRDAIQAVKDLHPKP